MPELPIEIWKDRINNELKSLKDLNFINEDLIEWKDNEVVMRLYLKAHGFILKSEEEPVELTPIKEHHLLLKIKRSFPYPGGINFTWQSEIFHPNIHPVELRTSKDDGTGYICLNILKQWSRLSDLESTIKAVRKLLLNPNPDDPLKYEICLKAADFFKMNPMEILKDKYDLEDLEEDIDEEEIVVIDE